MVLIVLLNKEADRSLLHSTLMISFFFLCSSSGWDRETGGREGTGVSCTSLTHIWVATFTSGRPCCVRLCN